MADSKLKIVYRKCEELIHPDYNPRKITPQQAKQIRDSIQEYGFVAPLVVNTNKDRKNIVIGGNQRLDIAMALGMAEVPTVEKDLPLEEEKKLN